VTAPSERINACPLEVFQPSQYFPMGMMSQRKTLSLNDTMNCVRSRAMNPRFQSDFGIIKRSEWALTGNYSEFVQNRNGVLCRYCLRRILCLFKYRTFCEKETIPPFCKAKCHPSTPIVSTQILLPCNGGHCSHKIINSCVDTIGELF